jgi:predicted nucleic acid-binding protein
VTLIVADTSPISLLVQLSVVNILGALFRRVIIPPAVARELAHPHAPGLVQSFARSWPTWITIQCAQHPQHFPSLDAGEAEAISLAQELSAPVLMDEHAGRVLARAQGVPVVGAIGVLEEAANRGLIVNLEAVHQAIRLLRFRVQDSILTDSLARHLVFRNTRLTSD